MKLEKIAEILKKEHGIDLSKIDDNKEILTSLMDINSENKSISKDLVLAKLTEEEKTLITKMYESAELIERILNKMIRGIDKKIEDYKNTKILSKITKERIMKKLKYEKTKIEELIDKSKKMINETSIIIPVAILLIIFTKMNEIREIGRNSTIEEVENIDEKILTPALIVMFMSIMLIITNYLNEKLGEKDVINIKLKYKTTIKWVKNKTW